VEHPVVPDPFAALAEEDSDQLVEFIEQLQNAVDLSEANVARTDGRISKVEADREILRSRLDLARDELSRIQSHPLGRLASRLTRLEDRPDSRSTDATISDPIVGDHALRVATILDEISDACWSPEFTNTRLLRQSWQEQIESAPPDLLFVESAFNGFDGSWARRVAHFGGPHDDLAKVVSFCRDLGIPTVFWNKEDPVNYAWFIGAASLFDHVFTVDADQIPRYCQQLGHERVHVLPFAAQPKLHFPPQSDTARTNSVGFAGSYYARKHAQRRAQMDMLLTPALEFDLDIYDRMDRPADPRFAWPDLFRSRIVGSVPYTEMGDVYRRYKVFLNVNTVTDSPTMCARRIYELAATGTPIVSGPSEAVAALVPPGVVAIASSAGEARDALRSILNDPLSRTTKWGTGPEWIASGNTYSDRMHRILGGVG